MFERVLIGSKYIRKNMIPGNNSLKKGKIWETYKNFTLDEVQEAGGSRNLSIIGMISEQRVINPFMHNV